MLGHDEDCLVCKRKVDSRERDVVIRQLVQRLVVSKFYPKLFRCLRELPVCVNCFLDVPFIEHDICEYCGRAMDALNDQIPINRAQSTGLQSERLQCDRIQTSREPISQSQSIQSQSILTIGSHPTNHERICRDCLDHENKQLWFNRSIINYNPWAKEIMALYKYRGEERLSVFLAVLLLVCYYRYVSNLSFQCISYVPLHKKREEERGFNQVELIAKEMSKYLEIPVVPLLQRSKETEKQSQQTSKQARIHSMEDAFTAYPPKGIRIERTMKPIVLLDDIYTTGSTLQACATQIREIPQLSFSPVISLTVCR